MQVHEASRTGCPSCEAPLPRAWGKRDSHEILECSECGVLYFPRPIERKFDYEDYYPYLAEYDRARFEWELRIRRPKFLKQLQRIRELAPDARSLLDIGAGPGYFCAVAAELGWDALAIEPSENARVAGTKQFGVRYVDLAEIKDGSIDVIACHHVLEHVEDINDFLGTLRRKLVAGGLLVLHVPNQQPLSFLLRNRIAGSGEDTSCSLYYPIHINGFTTKSLASTVERLSFKAISLKNASMWSPYYDPFFLKNYYRGKPVLSATAGVIKHSLRCLVDVAGNGFDRGDWIIGHFRAV